MIEYISKTNCVVPISICVTGIKNITLKQVHVELHWKHSDTVDIYNTFPSKPEKSALSNILNRHNRSKILINRLADETVVSYYFDTIHTGQTVVADEDIFVCSTASTDAAIEVIVYSDNNQPITLPLKVSFIIEKKPMDLLKLGNFEEE